jgi:hypothetical protein
MDTKNDQIAHRRIVAGRDILRKYGRNNNSPATRRECLDHVIVLNETGLRRILKSYVDYYERARTHLSSHSRSRIGGAIRQSLLREFQGMCQVAAEMSKFGFFEN